MTPGGFSSQNTGANILNVASITYPHPAKIMKLGPLHLGGAISRDVRNARRDREVFGGSARLAVKSTLLVHTFSH